MTRTCTLHVCLYACIAAIGEGAPAEHSHGQQAWMVCASIRETGNQRMGHPEAQRRLFQLVRSAFVRLRLSSAYVWPG